MTKEEHKLIIAMLASQLALTSKLVDALVENRTLTPADLTKIWRDALEVGTAKDQFFEQVALRYRAMAARCGVKLPE
jgi:hypothetical protein